MFGIRPAFSDELEPVRVDVQVLELKFRDTLQSIFKVGSEGSEFQSLHVDVTSRLMPLSSSNEWRINLSASQVKVYVAVCALIREIEELFDAFIELGKMMPQEYTVSVWALKNSDPRIIGSIDK